MQRFLETRQEKWKRLEDLTARASRYRLTGLKGEEVREFGRLYRRTAADLAIAREEVRDNRLINYLNHLVGRAHGAIYRSDSSGFGGILRFYRYEFPALFRKTFRSTLLAFNVFVLGSVFAFVVCTFDESFADRITGPGLRQDIREHRDWTDAVKNPPSALMSSAIQTRNIQVTFFAFAGGVIVGIGTFFVLLMNGMMLGAVLSLCITHRFWNIPIFITGHGVLELSAIFISGGAGFLIGKALLMPGDLRRVDALVTNGLLAIKLICGCIPMLLIAGTIEGFISPAHIPPIYKFSVSIVSLIAMTAYFMKPDMRKSGSEQQVASS